MRKMHLPWTLAAYKTSALLKRNWSTARQNGFIYKVKTQAKDYQNLKVDTLRVQNNYELKSPTVEIFSHKFCLPPLGFELTTPRFEAWCATTELRHWYTQNFVAKISLPFWLHGSALDFKSGGREFKSRWGQTKIYLKKIWPWGILIYSYFEPLRVIF